MTLKEFLSTKKAFFLLFLIFIFLGYMQFKQIKRQRAIDAEKLALITQTQGLEQKNKQLEDSLSYLHSEEFKERIAREQLNLKKEGEMVFNFTEGAAVAGASTAAAGKNEPSGSNFEKWVKYFSKKP